MLDSFSILKPFHTEIKTLQAFQKLSSNKQIVWKTKAGILTPNKHMHPSNPNSTPSTENTWNTIAE